SHSCVGLHRDLYSFPTRRSSDLLSILGTVGTVVFAGWAAIISATIMSFFAGILLILLVALPPLLVRPEETGRLSAGTFLVGYTLDRKSTRLNSSHVKNSYAVYCL